MKKIKNINLPKLKCFQCPSKATGIWEVRDQVLTMNIPLCDDCADRYQKPLTIKEVLNGTV